MHPSPLFCVSVLFWSVLALYKSVFPIFLGLILMECAWSLKILTQMGGFGCGFFVFGCSSSLGKTILLFFVAFGLGFRVLQFGGFKRMISRVLRDGFCSKRVCNHGLDWKNKGLACGVLKESRNLNKPKNGGHYLEEEKDDFLGANEEFEEQEEEGEEVCTEDEVSNVIDLRKMVKDQRRSANAAVNDLEKERMASASAAEEAMAMILRLQNEKSSLQIETNQLQRMREERQAYDQEVIQSLQRVLMQYEDERSVLEKQLKLCKKRLRIYLQDDEIELIDCMSSPCNRSLSKSRLAGCRLEDLFGGSLD